MVHLPLPFPFLHRPRVGSRVLVRSYVRRYLSALYKEIQDWLEEARERASNLLLCCIVYTEDYMTQFLDHLLVSLYKALMCTESAKVKQTLQTCLHLIGRFSNPNSYGPLVISALRNELASYIQHTQNGAIKAIGYMLAGTIEALPDGNDLGRIERVIDEFVTAVNEVVLDSLYFDSAGYLIDTVGVICDALIEKKELDIGAFKKHEYAWFYMIVRSQGVLSLHELLGKAESERDRESRKKAESLFTKLALLFNNDDFYRNNMVTYFEKLEGGSKNWTMQSFNWRTFYVISSRLTLKDLTLKLSDQTTLLYDRVADTIADLISNQEAKNFNVKSACLFKLLPGLVGFPSDKPIRVIHSLAKVQWPTKEEWVKNQIALQQSVKEYLKVLVVKLNGLEEFESLMADWPVFFKERVD